MSIEVKNITKTFGNFTALKDVSLKVPTGELVALLGPSGSGKTTLLRIIAGLEQQDSGQVFFEGEDTTHSHPRERRVGFVFQHYALFRHMTVFENVAFGLRIKPRRMRPPEEEIRKNAHNLLKMVQLDWLADRYPGQLSGGQRQRVALARALAVQPKVLLLDEPFGSLDAKVRMELRRWLRRLHDEIHITSVFVTHDQEEALEVADYVVVMNEGRIEQIGAPEEVYDNPANPFVYNFLGNVNLFHSQIRDGKAYIGNYAIDLPVPGQNGAKNAVVCVRPHQLNVSHQQPSANFIHARVKHINRAGPVIKLELTTDWGDDVHAELPQERLQEISLEKGKQVFVGFQEMRIFTDDRFALSGLPIPDSGQ